MSLVRSDHDNQQQDVWTVDPPLFLLEREGAPKPTGALPLFKMRSRVLPQEGDDWTEK